GGYLGNEAGRRYRWGFGLLQVDGEIDDLAEVLLKVALLILLLEKCPKGRDTGLKLPQVKLVRRCDERNGFSCYNLPVSVGLVKKKYDLHGFNAPWLSILKFMATFVTHSQNF